ncbi:MAG TPA: TatD family hydrolase [Clostridium sp.]|uniref:TatD family hydrolase n=1 Tax=Clostridium sp. TaxID=1506 RepID=UPI002F9452E3
MSNLVDFHFHLDYYSDNKDKYNYLNEHKIYTLCVTNLPEIYEQCINTYQNTKYVKFALGFNPQFAGSENLNKKLFNKYMETTKYIGEVGLDYSKEHISSKSKQITIFDYICSLSKDKNKIFSVHSRGAEADVLEILVKNKIKSAVFHWYSGKVDFINDIVGQGYYLSVNYSMTKSKTGREIIKNIPLNKILVESDGPFVQVKGKPITPEELILTYENIESIQHIDNMINVVQSNLKKLLRDNE